MRLISEIKDKYSSSELAQRMINGTFWQFSGTALAKFIVLVAGIVVARILGKESYGEFGMIRSTIMVFVALGLAGLGLTATKFISEYRKDKPEKVPSVYNLTRLFSIILGCIISGLIIILAPVIADKTLNSEFLTNDLRWGGILLFFTILNGVQGGVLSGFEDFKSIAFNTLYGSIAESILMCVGAYWWGVTGAIIGFGTGYIVIYILNRISINHLFARHGIRINSLKINREDFRIIYQFSIPAALSSLITVPVLWIIKSLLVLNNGYGQLAIYEAADQWKVIILFIPTAISGVILPILSSLVHDDKKRFWKILNLNLILNGSVAMILTLIVCLGSSIIMNLYGNGFDNPVTLIVLCLSTIPTAIATVIGLSISSRNKMWIGLSFNILWGTMVVFFSIYFLQLGFGATGLALAITCAYVIHSLIQYIYLKRIDKHI